MILIFIGGLYIDSERLDSLSVNIDSTTAAQLLFVACVQMLHLPMFNFIIMLLTEWTLAECLCCLGSTLSVAASAAAFKFESRVFVLSICLPAACARVMEYELRVSNIISATYEYLTVRLWDRSRPFADCCISRVSLAGTLHCFHLTSATHQDPEMTSALIIRMCAQCLLTS